MQLLSEKPLISVITVCYDAEEFIESCLTSVIAQDFDDFEYIVIDGGSKDGTVVIIEPYLKHISYYHSRPDQGIADAFNQGIAEAKGHWIIFLNADDYLASNSVLREMSAYLLQYTQYDVVYGQIQLVSRTEAAEPVSDLIGGPFRWSALRRKQNIPHPAAFHTRSYFDRTGLFDKSFKIAMDYEHYLRLGQNLKAQFVPLIVTEMREGGISKQSTRASLHEGYLAQVKTGALSKGGALMLFYIHLTSFYLSSLCREIMGSILNSKVKK